jgi:hypothetical protein
LERTDLGRQTYVDGGKQETARLGGTNTGMASGYQLDASAAARLHAQLRAVDGLHPGAVSARRLLHGGILGST